MFPKISVIGLGYVGLPLAIAFAEKFPVVGFDINKQRINSLKKNIDITNEITSSQLKKSKLILSEDKKLLTDSDFFIITVPTPVFLNNNPDLSMLKSACELVGMHIRKGSVIVFESTVYPGCTEDFCVPLIEKVSKLKFKKDFSVGYSPERINPGDKKHTFTKINKVVSASDQKTCKKLAKIYGSVIKADIFLAKSIKVAEAAKIIENTQRDINIALMNEFSLILQKMNIRSKDVLDAANTKWNFLDFKPGLVGGHCIGVDPYYLAYKAKKIGVEPKIILSGRDINNSMPRHIVKEMLSKMIVKKPKVLILGLSFKPNCPDIRNSKVLDVINQLNKNNIKPHLYDPLFSKDPNLDLNYKFQNSLQRSPKFHSILLLVPHKEFISLGSSKIKEYLLNDGYFFDLMSAFPLNQSDGSL
ncbi:nucleotide sugar dehydrogenase [Gammaproteobacteria bacterium]|nr:nucleotide sugar dehydrogenase [Gammaproteobacteria bacterium]MDC0919311.1 nucleotide sugar dehydrogenase [Gammaproteobacteria bacterium]